MQDYPVGKDLRGLSIACSTYRRLWQASEMTVPKSELFGCFSRLNVVCLSLENLSVANSVDLDQTTPRGAVCSRSALLVCMPKIVST